MKTENHKKKVSLKTKLSIGVSTSLAAVSGTVVPLTIASCGKQTQEINALQYDKEYGVSEATYKTLVKKFKVAYNYQLKYEKHLPNKLVEKEMNSAMKLFDVVKSKALDSVDNQNLAGVKYTTLTENFINVASKVFKVKLNRHSKAQWSDVDDLYAQMRDSFDLYMKNTGFPRAQRLSILNNANKEFNTYSASLKHRFVDPLSGIIAAKSELIRCFGTVNQYIGFIAAQKALNEFFQRFTITLKDDTTKCEMDYLYGEGHKKEDPESKRVVEFKAGSDLTPWMNDMMDIVDNDTGEKVPFHRWMIPGYRICPVIKSINDNDMANSHSIDVDWTCVKDVYVGKSTETIATAHLFKAKEGGEESYSDAMIFPNGVPDEASTEKQELTDEEMNNLFTNFFSEEDILTTNYRLCVSAKKEAEQVKSIYLGSYTGNVSNNNVIITQKLHFKWDESSKCYDAFERGTLERVDNEGNYYYRLNTSDLAMSGLMISDADETKWYKVDQFVAPNTSVAPGSEPDEGHKPEEYEDVPQIILDFFDNCELQSDCVLYFSEDKEGEPSKHIATNHLWVRFKNSRMDDALFDSIDYGDGLPTRKTYLHNQPISTNGFPYSKSAYYEISKLFAAPYGVIQGYVNNEYQEMYDSASSQLGLSTTFNSLAVVADGLTMFAAIRAITKPSPFITFKIKVLFVFSAILSGIDLAASAVDLGLTIGKLFVPTKKQYDIAEDLKNESSVREMWDWLNQEAKSYSMPTPDLNTNVPEDTYWRTYESFKNLPSSDVKHLRATYSDVWSTRYGKPVVELFADEDSKYYDYNFENFEKEMKPWAKNGWLWITSLSIMVGSILLMIPSCIVSRKIEKEFNKIKTLESEFNKKVQETLDIIRQQEEKCKKAKLQREGMSASSVAIMDRIQATKKEMDSPIIDLAKEKADPFHYEVKPDLIARLQKARAERIRNGLPYEPRGYKAFEGMPSNPKPYYYYGYVPKTRADAAAFRQWKLENPKKLPVVAPESAKVDNLLESSESVLESIPMKQNSQAGGLIPDLKVVPKEPVIQFGVDNKILYNKTQDAIGMEMTGYSLFHNAPTVQPTDLKYGYMNVPHRENVAYNSKTMEWSGEVIVHTKDGTAPGFTYDRFSPYYGTIEIPTTSNGRFVEKANIPCLKYEAGYNKDKVLLLFDYKQPTQGTGLEVWDTRMKGLISDTYSKIFDGESGLVWFSRKAALDEQAIREGQAIPGMFKDPSDLLLNMPNRMLESGFNWNKIPNFVDSYYNVLGQQIDKMMARWEKNFMKSAAYARKFDFRNFDNVFIIWEDIGKTLMVKEGSMVLDKEKLTKFLKVLDDYFGSGGLYRLQSREYSLFTNEMADLALSVYNTLIGKGNFGSEKAWLNVVLNV